MITNSKQKWEIGSRVKVGFMTLTVVSSNPTPGDYAPDEYLLLSDKGKGYIFVPHNGLRAI